MWKIILASQSPRRKDLLTEMGLNFDVVPSNFDEKLDDNQTPDAVAIKLALGKASQVAMRFPEAVVIGSDTIVTYVGKQLEKPHDKAEARRMLAEYAGTHNDVTTSVIMICKVDNILLTGSDTTRVCFKPYDVKALEAYVETGDPLDKAGAYGIQSGAAPLIDHIEGYYDTVIGLPTHLLARFLAQVGISAKIVELQPPVKQILT